MPRTHHSSLTIIAFPFLFPLVHTQPSLSPALFPFETIQLTPTLLSNLSTNPETAPYAHLYSFDTTSFPNPNMTHGKGFCKTYLGDANWPSQHSWDVFNNLLDGALIPTVPLAAPCFDSEWGKKDEKRCEDITAKFGTPYLQYVPASNIL